MDDTQSQAKVKKASWLLRVSLVLNLIFIVATVAWVSNKGGPRYLFEQFGLIKTNFVPMKFQVDDLAKYRAFPNTPGSIVFMGDSITRNAPFEEFLSPLKNRGIGADTSLALVLRADEVTARKPAKLFIAIGTNDLSKEVSPDEIMGNVRDLIAKVRAETPATELHLVGVTPINCPDKKNTRYIKKKAGILEFNAKLKAFAEKEKIVYIDPAPVLGDANGDLKEEYDTGDGLHINFKAYEPYCEMFRKYVVDQKTGKSLVDPK